MRGRDLASTLIALTLGSRAYAAGVRVTGTADCPNAAQVSAELERISPGREAGAPQPQTQAHVSMRGDVLWVELQDERGTPLAARGLSASGSCAARASLAAVVIAAWSVDLRSMGGAPLLLPDRSASAPASPIAATATARAEPPANGSGIPVELSAALVGSMAGGALAGGALVEVAIKHSPRGFAERVALLATTERDIALAPGSARWRRATLALGPRFRQPAGPVALDLYGEALLAWLTVRGQGYAVNRSSNGFDVGLGAGLRALIGRTRAAPWLGVAVSGWPSRHDIEADGVMSTARLPRLELLATAGIAFDLSR